MPDPSNEPHLEVHQLGQHGVIDEGLVEEGADETADLLQQLGAAGGPSVLLRLQTDLDQQLEGRRVLGQHQSAAQFLTLGIVRLTAGDRQTGSNT